jgi:DNA gyrase subunit B
VPKVKATTYNEDSIKVLQGLEPVRKKYGMYIGNNDHTGIWQIVKEPIANSLDEALAGFNDSLVIAIDTKRNRFIVADGGRGMPVGIHKTTKISTLTTILTVLHAGGKIDATNTAYTKGSQGTFGVGVSVTNALSLKLKAYTFRDNKWWYQEFKQGKPVTEVVRVKVDDLPKFANFTGKGTIISFEADPEIFGKSTIQVKEPMKWLNVIAYFYPNVKFTTIIDNKKNEFQHKEGIPALVKYWMKKADIEPVGKTFYQQDNNVTCALQWSESVDEHLTCFVNTLEVSKGTHVAAINKIITDTFAKYKPKNADYKPENLRAGLFGVLNISINSPAFGGQTKEVLLSPEAKVLINGVIKDAFEEWALKNKTLVKDLITRACALSAAEATFKINKKFAGKLQTTKKGRTLLPPELSDSITKNPHERELFIIEGKSAEGTCLDARNVQYQEILPLKGKILNVHKAKDEKIAANKEVEMILQSIGFNPALKDPYAKLRVDKVFLLSDADPDGKHINLLLSGFLYKALRPLIAAGKVFSVNLPLFTAPLKDRRVYGHKLNDILKQLPANYNRDQIIRMKGLGESLHEESIVGDYSIKDLYNLQSAYLEQQCEHRDEKIPTPVNDKCTQYNVTQKTATEIGTVLTKAGFIMPHPNHPLLVCRDLELQWVASNEVLPTDYLTLKNPPEVNKAAENPITISYDFNITDIAGMQNLIKNYPGLVFKNIDMHVCLPNQPDSTIVSVVLEGGVGHFSALEVFNHHMKAQNEKKLADEGQNDENVEDSRAKLLTLALAGAILGMRWTPILKTEFFKTSPHYQYDISILENDESLLPEYTDNAFIANGFVVHNCNPDVLKEIAFDPKSRRLIKLKEVKGNRIHRFLATLNFEVDFRKEILGLKNEKE